MCACSARAPNFSGLGSRSEAVPNPPAADSLDPRRIPHTHTGCDDSQAGKMQLLLKRIYDDSGEANGYRVLVDRLWPRGITKERARLDEWLRDLAPSTALRKWFGHDPARWDVFRRKYLDELKAHPDELRRLRAIARTATLILLYSAKDQEHNQAVVIREALQSKG